MSILSRIMRKRRGVDRKGSFSAEIEFHRTEELRPERLGPSADDLPSDAFNDPWRPSTTLGPIE